MARWVSEEEPGEVDADHGCVVVGGVVGERLGDVDAGIVDKGVDAAEAFECAADDPVGGGGFSDVPVDGEHPRVPAGLDRPGRGHHRPAPPSVLGHEAGADALGTSRDDGDLGVCRAHGLSRRQVPASAGSLGWGVSGVVCTLTWGDSGSDSRIASIWAGSAACQQAQRAALPRQRPESFQVALPGELPRPLRFALGDGTGAPGGGGRRNGGGERGQELREPGFGPGRSWLVGAATRVIGMGRERRDLIGAPHAQRHGGEDLLELGGVGGGEEAERAPFARLQRWAPQAQEVPLRGQLARVRRFAGADVLDGRLDVPSGTWVVMVTRNSIATASRAEGGAVTGGNPGDSSIMPRRRVARRRRRRRSLPSGPCWS